MPEHDSTISLAGSHRLRIEQGDETASLKLLCGADSVLEVRIDHGAVALRVRGASLSIAVDELLRLEARRIVLAALEDIELAAGGNIAARAGGEVAMTATDHRLTATPGRIRLRANDDVSLDGERVLVNCDAVGMLDDYVYGRKASVTARTPSAADQAADSALPP